MNIIRRLLKDLGFVRSASVIVKNEATVQALIELSKQENMPPEELVDELVWNAMDQHSQTTAAERLWNELSYREQQVVAMAVLGYSNPQIAFKLSLSISTVKTYLYSGFRKLMVHNRSELLTKFHHWDFEGWARANIRNL